MKLFGHHVTVSPLIALTLIAGGVGGIILDKYPKAGAVMAIVGIIGALWDHFSSEIKSAQEEGLFEIQAILLANKGIGNLYTEAGKLELNKGKARRAIERFQKALELDPHDAEALSSLGVMLAIELSLDKWLGRPKGQKFQHKIAAAKIYAQKGKEIAPTDHIFYDVLGIVCDVEGNHERARSEFSKSGTLRSDPFWHLLLATSWAMAGHHEQELAEIQCAIKKGAKYWLVDFYHGRALNRTGQYDQALPELKKAICARKWQIHLLRELADVYYAQGQFMESAKYAALCGIAMFRYRPIAGFIRMGDATRCSVIHFATRLSKRFWQFSQHIPILRKLHLTVCSPALPEATLGFMLIKRHHYTAAEKHLRKASEILPDSPFLLANLCTCLTLLGKRIEAIEKCDMAIGCAKNKLLLSQLTQYKAHLERNASVKPNRIFVVDPSMKGRTTLLSG